MSTAWAVAIAVLAALVALLGAAVLLLLSRVRELETRTQRVQNRLEALSRTQRTTPPPLPASSVVVMLEPDREADRALMADISSTDGLDLGVPASFYVPDDASGAQLLAGTGVQAAPFYRDRPLSPGFPSAVVLGADGAVLRAGSPTQVSELRGLVMGTPVPTTGPPAA